MSGLSKKLDEEIRNEAKDRCGYCLAEQKYVLAWLEIEHFFPRAEGGTSEKENLWLAVRFVILLKVLILTALIRSQREKLLFLILVSKTGKDILNLIRIKSQSLERLFADGRLFKL